MTSPGPRSTSRCGRERTTLLARGQDLWGAALDRDERLGAAGSKAPLMNCPRAGRRQPLRAGERAEQCRVGARVVGLALVGRHREQRGRDRLVPAARARRWSAPRPAAGLRGRCGIAAAVGAGGVALCDGTRADRHDEQQHRGAEHPAQTTVLRAVVARLAVWRSCSASRRRTEAATNSLSSAVRSGSDAARHSSTASRRAAAVQLAVRPPQRSQASALVARCRMIRRPSVSSSSQV